VKNLRVFIKTVAGISHEKEGAKCQDHSGCYEDDTLKIVVVADGHGEANSFRSDKGARFAVDCALDAIKDFVDRYQLDADEPARERAIGDLVRRVVALWQEKVKQHYTDLPFTPKELARCNEKGRQRFSEGEQHKAYGTTLIAAAITPEYWFGFHIGDGRFSVLREDGHSGWEFAQPVPWDERCFLSVTTSICDMSAQDRPRVYCGVSPPVAIFLCTDGIDDNYPVEENAQHLYGLYAQMALTLAEDGFDSAKEQIEQLCERFAKEGKGDDTSMAVMVDMERIRKPELKTWLTQEIQNIQEKKQQAKVAQIEAQTQKQTEIKPDAVVTLERMDAKRQNAADGTGRQPAKARIWKMPYIVVLLALLLFSAGGGGFLAYRHFGSQAPKTQTVPPGEAVVQDKAAEPSPVENADAESTQESDRHDLADSNPGEKNPEDDPGKAVLLEETADVPRVEDAEPETTQEPERHDAVAPTFHES
jgi:serine/threonine protein phosphatase PrpC